MGSLPTATVTLRLDPKLWVRRGMFNGFSVSPPPFQLPRSSCAARWPVTGHPARGVLLRAATCASSTRRRS